MSSIESELKFFTFLYRNSPFCTQYYITSINDTMTLKRIQILYPNVNGSHIRHIMCRYTGNHNLYAKCNIDLKFFICQHHIANSLVQCAFLVGEEYIPGTKSHWQATSYCNSFLLREMSKISPFRVTAKPICQPLENYVCIMYTYFLYFSLAKFDDAGQVSAPLYQCLENLCYL